MTRYRSQRDFRIITVLLAALAILAAACGNADDTDSGSATVEQPTTIAQPATTDPVPVPWQPLPADGKCRSGMVLRQGESCTHEYSCEAGISLGGSVESDAGPIIVEVSNVFSVDASGEPHYGRSPSEAEPERPPDDLAVFDTERWIESLENCPANRRISRSSISVQNINNMLFEFIANAQNDGTFYIEEAATNDSLESPNQPDATSAADCSVGMILSVGESCALVDGAIFYVESGETACFDSSICFGGGSRFGGFIPRMNGDGTWTIASIAANRSEG